MVWVSSLTITFFISPVWKCRVTLLLFQSFRQKSEIPLLPFLKKIPIIYRAVLISKFLLETFFLKKIQINIYRDNATKCKGKLFSIDALSHCNCKETLFWYIIDTLEVCSGARQSYICSLFYRLANTKCSSLPILLREVNIILAFYSVRKAYSQLVSRTTSWVVMSKEFCYVDRQTFILKFISSVHLKTMKEFIILKFLYRILQYYIYRS